MNARILDSELILQLIFAKSILYKVNAIGDRFLFLDNICAR